jgi:hypothetical protein
VPDLAKEAHAISSGNDDVAQDQIGEMLPCQIEGCAYGIRFDDMITVSAKNQTVQCAHWRIIIDK